MDESFHLVPKKQQPQLWLQAGWNAAIKLSFLIERTSIKMRCHDFCHCVAKQWSGFLIHKNQSEENKHTLSLVGSSERKKKVDVAVSL